jgi:deoxyribonuclease V
MKPLHPWKVTPEQAIRIQENLRHRIILKKSFSRVRTIGGGDVSYQKEGNSLFGAMVVLSFPHMETLDVATACGKISFPYLPGLLTFREGPILIKTFQKLRIRPDVLLFDGQGIAHPRGVGLATHLGIWFNLSSIGCAKTPLLGESVLPRPSKGSFELIQDNGREVGVVLRTKDRVRPVFVSPGHRIDLPTSIRLVLESCQGFRIPEPLRRAHQVSRQLLHRHSAWSIRDAETSSA